MSRMTRLSPRVLPAAFLLVLSAAAQAQAPTKAPPPGPVKPAALPAFQEARLPNGLRIMLVQSNRQPVLSLALMLPAGDAYDPAGKEGLASTVASVMTKGAGARSADDVSSAIEGVGGSIGASSGADFMTVRTNVLAENAPLAFELLADAVARPTFAFAEVELARTQALSALQLEQSQPSSLAARFFAAQLFGAHPYGKRPTPATMRAIGVSDLRAFQKSRLVPNGALLVVAGDVSLARTRELAAQYFGTWSGAAPAGVRRPQPPARAKTEILLVHRPGSVQSNIIVGNLTYAPANPSYYALTVASKILGGGADGRLFKTLRETKSWTYGAYSSLTRNHDIGTFEATAEVRNAVTDSALTELLAIERSLGTTAVSNTELEAGKGSLVGSLPLQLETAQGIAEQVGRYTMLGLPRDFIRTLRPRLSSVTAPQLKAAAQAYMRPEQSLIVVVGDGAAIYDKLAKIAPVRIVSAQGDAMTPSDLVPRTAVLPVDLTKLVERTDSFTVLVQGRPSGHQKSTLVKTASGYSYRSDVAIGPVVQATTDVTFGSDLRPQAVKSTGKVQGLDMHIDASYSGGRVKGTGVAPGATSMQTVTLDTTIASDVLDSFMLNALVPGLRWVPNAKYAVTVFDASRGVFRQVALQAGTAESVTVPAGTFQALRIEITGQEAPITMYVTSAAPHRIVKMALTGQPVEFVLEK